MAKRELTPAELEEASALNDAWTEYKEHHPGATQTWLGEESGLGTQGAVGQYLRGVIPLNLDALIKLCGVLGVNPRKISERLSAPLDGVISTLAVANRVENLLIKNGWEVIRLNRWLPSPLSKEDAAHFDNVEKSFDKLLHNFKPDFAIRRNGEEHFIELSMHSYTALEGWIQEKQGLTGRYHILNTRDVDRLIAEMQRKGLISDMHIAPAAPQASSTPSESIKIEFELSVDVNGKAIKTPLLSEGAPMFVPRWSNTFEGSASVIRGDGLRPRFKSGEAILVRSVSQPNAGDEVLITTTGGEVRLLEFLRADDSEFEFSSVNDHGRITLSRSEVASIDVLLAHYPRSAIIR